MRWRDSFRLNNIWRKFREEINLHSSDCFRLATANVSFEFWFNHASSLFAVVLGAFLLILSNGSELIQNNNNLGVV